MYSKDIAIPTTIHDMCDARDKAIKEYVCVKEKLEAIDNMLKGVGAGYAFTTRADTRMSADDFAKRVDQAMWIKAFDITNFSQVMDAKARDEFEKSLDTNPPPFTIENVRSQFLTASQDAEMMFARGVVEIFKSLSGEYKSHSAFKIKKRLIMRGMFDTRFGYMSVAFGFASRQVDDLDRVIKTLTGRKFESYWLQNRINDAMRNNGGKYEDEDYIIKGFMNGNAHITLKRQETIDKINSIIHDWFGSHSVAHES